jgi:hypothetical protein
MFAAQCNCDQRVRLGVEQLQYFEVATLAEAYALIATGLGFYWAVHVRGRHLLWQNP